MSGIGIDTGALKPISACFFDNKVWLAYTQKGDNGYLSCQSRRSVNSSIVCTSQTNSGGHLSASSAETPASGPADYQSEPAAFPAPQP
jgi:hypothetical protein